MNIKIASLIALIVLVVGTGIYYVSSKNQSHDLTGPADTENSIPSLPEMPTVQQDRIGFFVRDNRVYYQTSYTKAAVVEGLDASTFKLVNQPVEASLALLYAKDSDSVFVGDHLGCVIEIPGADPATFVKLEENFALDAHAVYVMAELGGGLAFEPKAVVVPGADPATFVVIGSGYAKDATHVYFSAWGQHVAYVVDGADPATFVLLSEPSPSDVYTFKAKDAYHTYDFGKKIEGW